jgi:hypothetical protein
MTLSATDFLRTIREDEMTETPKPKPHAEAKLTPEFTDQVLDFASEVFDYVMNELEGGDWRETFDAFSEREKAALFAALADAFNDTTEE